MSSEYRSVNFSDLCRLCAATQGNKLNVFSDSGRKQDLSGKIAECLPVRVEENDELPKSICELCVQQLHQISEYRQKCSNTDTMFRSCLGSPKLKNEGRVYVKDEAAKAGPGGSKPATNIVTLKNMKQTLVPLVSQQHQQQIHVQQQVQQHIQHQQLDANTMTISAGNDYLSNIVQSVGIKMDDGVDQPQYTYTLKEIQQSPSLNDQQRLQTYSQVDEFLKPKTDGNKLQYNLVVNNNQLQQITSTSTASVVSPQVKQVLTQSHTPFVLTTNTATGIRTATQQPQQQQKTIQMVQQATQKQQQQQCMIIKDNTQQVYQIKLEPQMSTVDGQTIYQLTQAPTQTFQAITPQQQNKIVSGMNPIQFTTLTNVASNSAKGSPTMITIQDTPGKGQTATQITPVGRIASTTITRKTPLVLKQNDGSGQVKYVTSPVVTNATQSTPIIVQSTSSNGNKMTMMTANKNPTLVTNKAVKMISARQPTIKTLTVSPNKVIPVHSINAMPSEEEETGIAIEVGVDKQNKPTCDVCQKEFKRKEHLTQHMKLHQGVRPFKCDQCDKAFNRKEHLLRHRTSHTGAKSFKCEHCQKMFSRKDNLNKHKRKHTGGEEDEGGKRMKVDDDGGE